MSAENLFYYKRKVIYQEKDEDGKPVTKETYVEDCFNIYLVTNGYWLKPDVFAVRLHDGHEESREVEKPQPKGKVPPRERHWYLTEIQMDAEDAARFRAVTEVGSPGWWSMQHIKMGTLYTNSKEDTLPTEEKVESTQSY